MLRKLITRLRGNELDRILLSASKSGKNKFLAVWNRGLGDIALGLCSLVHRIRTFVPDARITFITRKELEDAFRLLEGVDVIGVPWWQRGVPIELDGTLVDLGLDRNSFDIILEKVDPTKWLSWQLGAFTPRLSWDSALDEKCRRFRFNDSSHIYIGVHLSTETAQFYGYSKDWPCENWQRLFERLSELPDTKIILFGLGQDCDLHLPSVIDLRGKTDLLEMLSVIKNNCSLLIAPDGGVLSLTYYIDSTFSLTVVSLWGDSRQGVLKQGVSSPNRELVHIPLMGKDMSMANIGVDEVLTEIRKHALLRKSFPTGV